MWLIRLRKPPTSVGGNITALWQANIGKHHRQFTRSNTTFVFVPKYRFGVLKGKIKEWLKQTINQICENFEILLVEGEICKDHVYMCLSVLSKYSLDEVMKQIKGKTSVMAFREFPELFKRYWGQHFWAWGYFVSTVGIDEEMIRKYIRHRQAEHGMKNQLRLWKWEATTKSGVIHYWESWFPA